MLLMIDNYDSFTYNLVQYFGELGEDVRTYRNDEITLDEIAKLNPERICLSPGPSNPQHAGITLDVLREFAGKMPILGVCLGHQAIGEAFGGTRGARANHHARQGQHDRNRLQRRVRRSAEAFRRDPLSLARDRTRIAARLPRSIGMDRRRRDHGRASQGTARSKACSSIRNRSCPNTATRCSKTFVQSTSKLAEARELSNRNA